MGLRVLIVDDHAGFRLTCRRLLESDGIEVVAAVGDGASALTTVGSLCPDVVLVDVQLPDMDGFEVARRLDALGAGGVVVLTSSRTEAEYGGRVVKSSAAGFIPKEQLGARVIADLVESAR